MVVIDTDVLMIEFRYLRDERRNDNRLFLSVVRRAAPAITVYTLMETLGQLSFNMSAAELGLWTDWLRDAHGLDILWPKANGMKAEEFFREQIYQQPFAKMQTCRMPFTDALVLQLAENTPGTEAFVTWNARHFKGKTLLPVLTPAEYLAGPTSQPT